jgi:hypothetical protein
MTVYFFFSVPVCAITASGVPGGTLVSMNRFSTLCGWLAQRQGWRVKGWIWPSKQARSARANSWLDYHRPLEKEEMGEGEMRDFVYSSLWDFKSSFTCRKISLHGTFPLYFPSEGKMCCGFLSPLKIHRLGQVLNPQPWGPVASTLTTMWDFKFSRRRVWCSELSSGLYCRVNRLSTDVSEVRTASNYSTEATNDRIQSEKNAFERISFFNWCYCLYSPK